MEACPRPQTTTSSGAGFCLSYLLHSPATHAYNRVPSIEDILKIHANRQEHSRERGQGMRRLAKREHDGYIQIFENRVDLIWLTRKLIFETSLQRWNGFYPK